MKRGPSFQWLSLAVVLPLILLAILAWHGTRSQKRAVWTAAREEAKTSAAYLAELWAKELPSLSQREVPEFSDPPLPGPPAPPNDPLETDDVEALKKIRAFADPKDLSPAGIPRMLLAALKISAITGSEADASSLLLIATERAPSAISSKVIVDLTEKFPARLDHKRIEFWRQSLIARELVKAQSDIPVEGKWIDSFWIGKLEIRAPFIHQGRFLKPAGSRNESSIETRILFIDPVRLARSHRLLKLSLPRWAGMRLVVDGRSIDSPDTGEIMASAPIDFGRGLKVEILALHPEQVEAGANSQIRWTLATLFVAVATSAIGLWFIHRALDRERKLNALKSDFVASVSHELRAPIASIRLMADALEAGKIESKTAAEFHRLISSEGARLSTLIENVLDFARIEQGRKQWHLEESDLRELVLDSISLMTPIAAEKSIQLIPENFPDTATASIDPDAIRQALVNLLDNAIKFSPSGSTVAIRLSTSLDHSFWKIQIADQGSGIPRSDHSRIFEKFHRLGNELRRESQGTGIGLSMVKAIAEAHQGSIEIDSEPEAGSTFTLTLPVKS